jgi:4-hydroxy-tetrahydrodipicolinate reductase
MSATDKKPRIVINGTGQYGQFITRFAVQKGWPIVAAYNRAGPKIGQDLGRLAGLERDLGVIVQDSDTASFANLDADIGVVTASDRLQVNLPGYKRLMSAGLNVLCHGAEAYFPYGSDPKTAAEIDAIAKANNVSFTGSGIWDMSRIWAGILVAGPCTELRAMHHTSITDAQRTGKHLMLVTGVGMSVEEYTEKMVKAAGNVGGMYKTIPEHVLHALGYTITKTSERREPVVFDQPYYCRLLEKELAPGAVVGTRIIAEIETKQGVTADAHIELRCFQEGEIEHMGWTVDGMPHTRVRVERDDSGHATAACLFNRIPDVIAAPPGIQEIYKLGPLRATALA